MLPGSAVRVLAFGFVLVAVIACGGARSPTSTQAASAPPVAASEDRVTVVAPRASAAPGPVDVSVQSPHAVSVSRFVWSGDGRSLVSLAGDSTKLWDLRSGMIVRSVRSRWAATAVDAHASRVVGTSDLGQKLHLIDTEAFTVVRTLESKGFVSARFTPDGHVVTATVDGRILIVRSDTGLEVGSVTVPDASLSAMDVDARGRRVAVVTGSEARVFDLATRAPVCTVKPKREGVLYQMGLSTTSIAFDATGDRLALARNDGFDVVWDVARCQQVNAHLAPQIESQGTQRPAETHAIHGFVAGGRAIVVERLRSEEPDVLARWDLGKDTVETLLPGKEIHRAALSPDGHTLVVSTRRAQVSLVDLASGAELRDLGRYPGVALPLAIDEAHDTLYAVDDRRERVEVVDLRRATKLRTLALPRPQGEVVAMDAGGRAILAVSRERRRVEKYRDEDFDTIVSVDRVTGAAIPIEATGGSVLAMGVDDAAGIVVAAVNVGKEHHLRALDLATKRRRWDVRLKDDRWIERVVVSAASRLAVVVDSGRPEVWDVGAGRALGPLELDKHAAPHGTTVHVALSADGKRVLTSGGRGDSILWSLPSRAVVKPLVPRTDGGGRVRAFFDDARREIVHVDSTGEAIVFDAATLAERRRVRLHEGEAVTGFVTPSGKWQVSLGVDLVLRLLRREAASSGDVRMLVSASRDWLFLAPGDRYLAPKGALGVIGFRQGRRVYPFDQFDAVKNRPEAVLAELGAPPDAVSRARALTTKRLRRLGLEEGATASAVALPSIELSSAVPPRTSARSLELGVRADSAAADLDRIEVFDNEVPVATVPLRDRRARAAEVKIAVPLGAGSNRVQVSAWDAHGLESLRETVSVVFDAPPAKGTLHVVAVGVSKYKDSRFDLDYAAKDARDVAAALRARGAARFERVVVNEILDREATRERLTQLGELLAKTAVDDQIVVFVAGHGLLGPGSEYTFATTDIDPARPEATGVSFSALEGALRLAPARKKLLLVDTCHSGESDPDDGAPPLAAGVRGRARGLSLELKGAPPATPAETPDLRDSVVLLEEAFADVRRGSGAIVLASATGREFAFESGEQKNGLFTHALLEALAGKADRNGDGVVQVSELREWVAGRVSELSGGRQHPTARRENVTLDFPVY